MILDGQRKRLGESCGQCPGGSSICGPSTGIWHFGECASGLECKEPNMPNVLGKCEIPPGTVSNALLCYTVYNQSYY